MQFALFDAVELTESTTLAEGQIAPAGTRGAIVEVLEQGKAYLVELFGGWVKQERAGARIVAQPKDREAFVETLGIALVMPTQLRLHQPAIQTIGERARLLSAMEELPENLVKEVADFAEFLQHKTERKTVDARYGD